jgi:hypothetical protein
MYSLRSKIVHGSTVTDNLREVAQGAIRQLVHLVRISVGLGQGRQKVPRRAPCPRNVALGFWDQARARGDAWCAS